MLGLKQKRRMVRNPYMNNQHYYPFQSYQQSQMPFGQNTYHNPFPTTYNQPQPLYNPMNYQQSPYAGQGSTPFQMPYPNQGPRPVQAQKGGFQSIMSQFKNKDGAYDVNKMMNTAGQMMSTVNQLNGMVKQVGSFFKAKV
jgi:hypothetical protein